MKNTKNEILDILNRVEDSKKEYTVSVENSREEKFMVCFKFIDESIEADISSYAGGSSIIIRIGSKCDLNWIAETIYYAIEY